MSRVSTWRSREFLEMDLRVAECSSVLRKNFSREVMVDEVMEAESSRKALGGSELRGGVDYFMVTDYYYLRPVKFIRLISRDEWLTEIWILIKLLRRIMLNPLSKKKRVGGSKEKSL
jgi:hypothetical protein